MKKRKILNNLIGLALVMMISTLFAGGCSGPNRGYLGNYNLSYNNKSGDEFLEITENPVVLTSDNPLSTFSMHANTAAYANIRRYINRNIAINKNMVNIEDMVNYFRYSYDSPMHELLALNGSIFPCPWNQSSHLLSLGLKAEEIETSGKKNNLVFLLDVSGSMDSPDKIGLMQTAFSLLTENLGINDTVSIVTYAGKDAIILEGANGSEQKKILNKIEDLTAGGTTAGASGIKTAYTIAEKYFIDEQDANNRVILATDGDFNVGVSDIDALKDLIIEKRNQTKKIYLTCLGFGYGNLQSDTMKTLADNGNGAYHYIDSITEARKVLVEEIGGTLNVVAKDVKAQVEFNPKYIYSYRLLGYENNLLTQEQWEDENTDAGEIGSGHNITAVYEIVLQKPDTPNINENYLSLTVQYKDPVSGNQDDLIKYMNASDVTNYPDEDRQFIACVVEAALVMRDSQYKGDADIEDVIARLQALDCLKTDEYKEEFLNLMKKYKEQV